MNRFADDAQSGQDDDVSEHPVPRRRLLDPADDAQRRRVAEIRAELDDHVDRRAKALIAAGRTPAEARAEAGRRLGNRAQIEAACMAVARPNAGRRWMGRPLEEGARDVALALRGIRRRPWLAAGVIATVAVAMSAATSVFSVVNGVLVRPLAYPHSERLFAVYSRFLPESGYDFPYFALSGPEFEDYRAMAGAVTGVAAYTGAVMNLAASNAIAERVVVGPVTANLFDVLGVAAAHGRVFAQGEDAPGAECVSVLSDGLWRDRFGADETILGNDIRLDGLPCRVLGVMPAGFVFPDDRFRLWTALRLDPAGPTWGRQSHGLLALTRLAPNMTRTQADAELAALHANWSAEFPDHYANGHFLVLRSLRDDLVGNVRPTLLVLLGGAAVVLLIVCVNLAGLLISAAESRRREIAVRAALGGSRWRLTKQWLTESVLLACAGGALGLLASPWLVRALLALYPGRLPRAHEISLDGNVLLFTAAVGLIVGVAFGLIPAMQVSGVRSSEVLGGGRNDAGSRASTIARRVLVVAETALALILVAAAALLAQTYANLRNVDVGVQPQDAFSFALSVPATSYPVDATARDYFRRLDERLAALPGVAAVGAISNLPMRSAGPPDDFVVRGRALPAPGQQALNARFLMATPGAAAALGLRLVRGRWLTDADRPGTTPVAVINEAAARMYFANEDPIGQQINYFTGNDEWITIVGVTGDVRSLGVAADAPPAIYVPHAQAPRPQIYDGRLMNVVIRFRGARPSAAAIRAAAAELDPTLPLSEFTPLEQVLVEAIGQPRFTMTLMSTFATLALLLGALGLYAVLAHGVQIRRREIGIRITLGARPAELLRMVLRQGIALVSAGIAIGFVAALSLRHVVAGLLFGVSPIDPLSLMLAVGALLVVTGMACTLPAWRATRVQPSETLQEQ